MAKVMVSVLAPGGSPTAEDVERRFALPTGSVDRQFGVVEIDDLTHEYTVLVEETAAPMMRSDGDWRVSGPFANPAIAPFGPPRSDR